MVVLLKADISDCVQICTPLFWPRVYQYKFVHLTPSLHCSFLKALLKWTCPELNNFIPSPPGNQAKARFIFTEQSLWMLISILYLGYSCMNLMHLGQTSCICWWGLTQLRLLMLRCYKWSTKTVCISMISSCMLAYIQLLSDLLLFFCLSSLPSPFHLLSS